MLKRLAITLSIVALKALRYCTGKREDIRSKWLALAADARVLMVTDSARAYACSWRNKYLVSSLSFGWLRAVWRRRALNMKKIHNQHCIWSNTVLKLSFVELRWVLTDCIIVAQTFAVISTFLVALQDRTVSESSLWRIFITSFLQSYVFYAYGYFSGAQTVDYAFHRMGANNGKQSGSEGECQNQTLTARHNAAFPLLNLGVQQP